MLYFIARLFFLLFFRMYLGFKIIGRENIPGNGPFIFASNHASFLDPILLGTSCRRGLYYLARETLFNKRICGWALRNTHSIPVSRHDNVPGAIKQALKLLKKGRPLVMFPEGTRSKDGRFHRGLPGTGFIAAKSKVPVVPVYIKGSFDAMPRDMKSLKRRPVIVYIGRPVIFDSLDYDSDRKETYQRISNEIMRKVAEIKESHEKKDSAGG